MNDQAVVKRSIAVAKLAVLVIVVLSTFAGCAGGGSTSGVPSVPPPTVTAGVARLDMATASFTLPLDAYGMSVHDVGMVEAAHTVQFYICMGWQDTTLKTDGLTQAKAWLTASPAPNRWILTWWDAPYIAKYDYGAEAGPNGTPDNLPAMGPTTDPIPTQVMNAMQDCVNNNAAVQEFAPNSPTLAFGSGQLGLWWGQAFGYAMTDQRFVDLGNQRNDCIAGKGYPVEPPADESAGGLGYDSSWTGEQVLAAKVAAAQCADDMNYMQQALDIVAAYQMLTVSQHEAELVAIKQSNDALVAKATDLLKQYGVM